MIYSHINSEKYFFKKYFILFYTLYQTLLLLPFVKS